jgi:hypothetical protein
LLLPTLLTDPAADRGVPEGHQGRSRSSKKKKQKKQQKKQLPFWKHQARTNLIFSSYWGDQVSKHDAMAQVSDHPELRTK